ncbi:O-antigen ligase family protein [Candidatus Falkowbacteria bacterium]|nr:O-antigen ligase family protein [Candidatus Falkowbacteria bacterium]
MINFFGKTFRTVFLFIVLFELLSFLGYFYPMVNKAGFFIITAAVLALSLYKLEYGIYIALAELFVGSKGYLFYFEQGGLAISIRVALWLIVMSVWLGAKLRKKIAEKRGRITQKDAEEKNFLRIPYFSYFFILFIFIGWGLINGILRGNDLGNVFFDFNNWLYFALIFPIYNVIASPPADEAGSKATKQSRLGGDISELNPPCPLPPAAGLKGVLMDIFQIFTAAILWLCVKTFFLLFVFSHNIQSITYELYRWTRVSGIGEVTQVADGFSRIFFQSHIFVLVGFFVFLVLLTIQKDVAHRPHPISLPASLAGGLTKERGDFTLFSVVCFLLSVIIITFSRSFWAALIAGLLIYCLFFAFYKIGWRKFFIAKGVILVSFVLAIGIIFGVIKFPYPKPTAVFSTEFLSERATAIYGEAGASSRWALLPKLWAQIKKTPVLGQGFGATVTYKTSDPRVLESSPTGEYTTYAFEWGWLDIWLKLGVFGLLAYFILAGKIIYDGLIKNSKLKIQNDNKKFKIILGFTIGLLVIFVVNIFSPYLNHPLGIGYLILAAALIGANQSSPLA